MIKSMKITQILLRFLVVNVILFVLTGPVLILFGPFENVKRSVVGAILTSRHPQYISWLYTPEELKRITGALDPAKQPKQDLLHFNKREDTSLKLVHIDSNRFVAYLLEIPDPTRVKAVTAKDIQEKGDTTSTMAINNNAVAAINAGGFYDPNGTGTGRLPYGVIVSNGQFLVGGDIEEKVPLVGLTKAGALVAGEYSPSEMRQMNVAEGVSFGPPLIINGQKLITHGDGGWGVAPRTAIGQRKDGTILFLVVDGRQPGYSLGATLMDIQNILYDQGAQVAANLDGGSSTTMYLNNKVVNKPCDMLGERMIPTAFVVK